MPVFVDDMTLASQLKMDLDKFIIEQGKHFKLQDLRPTTQLLGIKIDHDHLCWSISLSQHQYTVEILQKFGMENCKLVSTPMEPGLWLSNDMSPKNEEEQAHMKTIHIWQP